MITTQQATRHQKLTQFVDEWRELCQPESVHWCDGSATEYTTMVETMVEQGYSVKLDERERPDCYLFRSDPSDVARVENRTYIASEKEADAGPTNNWMSPEEGYERAGAIFRGSMRGRTMYVIPFSMGPIGSPFSKFGVELTDSIYVVLNMRIMTRMGETVLDAIGADFLDAHSHILRQFVDGDHLAVFIVQHADVHRRQG